VKICAIRGKKKEQSNKTPNQLKSVQSVAKKRAKRKTLTPLKLIIKQKIKTKNPVKT